MKTSWFSSTTTTTEIPLPTSSTVPPSSHGSRMSASEKTFLVFIFSILIFTLLMACCITVLEDTSRQIFEACSSCFNSFSSAVRRITTCRNAIRRGREYAIFNNRNETIHLSTFNSSNFDLEAANSHVSDSPLSPIRSRTSPSLSTPRPRSPVIPPYPAQPSPLPTSSSSAPSTQSSSTSSSSSTSPVIHPFEEINLDDSASSSSSTDDSFRQRPISK